MAALERAMLKESGDIAREAAEDLYRYAKKGDAEAIKLAKKGLSAHEDGVRRICAGILMEIKDRSAVPQLIELLADKSVEVRKAAVRALGRIRAKEAQEKLKRIKDKDPDKGVRRAAEIALTRIAKSE